MAVWIRWIALMFAPLPALADVNVDVQPLPCGIYDQNAQPFVEKDLDTQSSDRSHFTMAMKTRKGRRLSVEIQNVNIKLKGERSHVSVFLDGKPLAKTSHQDVPIYLEVHVDDEKHRIICVRGDVFPTDDALREKETGLQQGTAGPSSSD